MPNDFRSLIKALDDDRKEQRDRITTAEYFRHMYGIRLLQKANISNVDPMLTRQYGIHHDAAWVEDSELTRRYMSLNQRSLIAWNAHHYAKLVCRCIDFIGNFSDPDNFSLIFMQPRTRNAVQKTLKSFISEATARGNLDGIGATPIGKEIEVLNTMLQGFHGMRKIHSGTSTTERHNSYNTRVDTNDVCVNVEVFNDLMHLRNAFRCDMYPEFTWNAIPSMNEHIRWLGILLSVYSSLVELHICRSSWVLDDKHGFSTLDEFFELTMRDFRYNDTTYKDALEAIRHMANPNQVTQEVAISLLRTPVYCECKDDTFPIYGDTDVERYLVCDYMVRSAVRKSYSDPVADIVAR